MHLLKRTYILLLSLALTVSACKKTERSEYHHYQTPIIDFNWSGQLNAPATVTFSNLTLLGSSFTWDFGNGVTSDQKTPAAVTFTQPGTYEVVLRAVNGDKTASIKKTITIEPNNDPVALFSYTYKNNSSIAPATVSFINESINADSYEWLINGVSYITTNPSNIIFNQAGDYEVKLIAIKGNKRSAVYESTVTVLVNTDPVAKFALPYHPYPYTVGEEIQLVNRSLNSDEWTWTFGVNGPAPSSEEHPVIKFTTAGVHTITLIAKKGAKISAPRSINLKID